MWKKWLKSSTQQVAPTFPPLPDYPEIGEPFRPEYEKMIGFFYDNLRPLMLQGYVSSDAMAASAHRWDEITRAISKRLATYDFTSDRSRSQKALHTLINAAQHMAVLQIKDEAARMAPENPLQDEQINAAIDTLNGLFGSKIWPENAQKSAARG